MNLFDLTADLEEDESIHLARLLILLRGFADRDGLGTVDGLTKLAKLDFLLRYPVYLEQALQAKGQSGHTAHVAEHERLSIESRMIRFRDGPGDHRYRRFINILSASDLAHVTVEGRTIKIGLTQRGLSTAVRLAQSEVHADIQARVKTLHAHFDQRGTHLMRFIYETFPQIASLRYGEEIS